LLQIELRKREQFESTANRTGERKMGKRLCGLSFLFLLYVLVAGCSGKSSSQKINADVRPPIAHSDSDEFHYDDPCSLLEPKEVEAALGAPLGTQPYRAWNGNPAPNGPDCVYQTAKLQQITFTVTFKDGAQAYRFTGFARKLLGNAPTDAAKQAFKLDDGTELAGEWDEANLTAMNCCIFNALRADQMITIDFTGSQTSLRQAATLVDTAFRRIDKPLKLDGASNVAAAKAFLQTRPKEVSPCTLVTQAEAEAILGALAAPPKANGTSSCDYQLAPKDGMPGFTSLSFNWRGGNAAFRSDAHVGGIAGMAMGGAASPKEEPSLPAGAPGDPWERGGMFGNDFMAIKKDVRVKVIQQGMIDHDKAKALAAAAMRKI
jgi:hypothetical protein